MESELVSLRRRVAELEAALAIVSKKTGGAGLRRWVALAPMMCAGVLILGVGILLGGGAAQGAADAVLVCAGNGGQLRLPAKASCESRERAVFLGGGAWISGTAQSGPSKVVEPFVVVDKAGRELFKVTTASGNSVAIVYDNKGTAQVTLGSPIGQGQPQIQVVSSGGDARVGIGITTEGNGQIRLTGGPGKTRLSLSGAGGLSVSNKNDKRVVSLGGSEAEGGAGSLHLYDSKGNEQVTIHSPAPGSGKPTIQVLGSDGSLKAGIGESTKGSGMIVLKGGSAQTSLWLNGSGGLSANNAQDKVAVALGVSGFGGGDLHLYNSSGTAVVGIFSEQGQTGIAQLFNAAGQERVTLGTLTTGKGDVCASGDKGANCLSKLNPKY